MWVFADSMDRVCIADYNKPMEQVTLGKGKEVTVETCPVTAAWRTSLTIKVITR